jgi:hypothetical protein
MDTLYTIVACAAVVGALIGIYKVISHPVNQANFEYYTNNPKEIDPWSYLNYRHPPY